MNGVEKGKKLAEVRTMKTVRMEKLQSKHLPLKQAVMETEEEEDKKSEGGSDLDLTPNGSTNVSETERCGLELSVCVCVAGGQQLEQGGHGTGAGSQQQFE